MAAITNYVEKLDSITLKEVQNFASKYYNQLVNKGVNVGELLDELVAELDIDVLYFDFNQSDAEDEAIHGIYLRSHDQSMRVHKIIINNNDSEKTQNFTLAHELFHHLLMEERPAKLIKLLPDDKLLERAGDHFAACFLMNSKIFEVNHDFLNKNRPFEEVVMKLSDVFITPYESVVRRLYELNLLPDRNHYLLELREEELIIRREKFLGPTVLDAPSQKNTFQPYINLVIKGLEEDKISYLNAIKRLNKVSLKKAQEIEQIYRGKLAEIEADD